MNNELRALLLTALQEETCGLPPAAANTQPVSTSVNSNGAHSNGSSVEATPTPETPVAKQSINYWPLLAVAAVSYLFLTDGK